MGTNGELLHQLLSGYGTIVLTGVGWFIRSLRKSEMDFRKETRARIEAHGERISKLEGRLARTQ
jgi:hypothetical protein